jgi:hypothetical protein
VREWGHRLYRRSYRRLYRRHLFAKVVVYSICDEMFSRGKRLKFYPLFLRAKRRVSGKREKRRTFIKEEEA